MYLILSQKKMIRKDARTCMQEAKRGQCLPGFDSFVCIWGRNGPIHHLTLIWVYVALSNSSRSQRGDQDLTLSKSSTLISSLPLHHLSPLLSVPSSVCSEVCLYGSRTTIRVSLTLAEPFLSFSLYFKLLPNEYFHNWKLHFFLACFYVLFIVVSLGV